MSIIVRSLTKLYGSQKAVNNLNFSIGKGEIVGFLGPNGAGKSTTMKMITGYLQADSGSIEVAGIPVKGSSEATKRKIGYLPEANPLYMDMYVKEYLDFIAGIHGVDNRKKRIDEVIALTGLTIEQKKKIGQLSKGYKQRTGLAAALIHQPEVLILDEPTTGLDPNQIIEIRNVIKEQGKDKTVLFSSHILQEVQAVCDRVIIIHRGNLVADSSLASLQATGGSNTIRITFKEAIDGTMLQQATSATQVRQVDAYTWMLEAQDVNLVKKQLLEISLQHQLNIVSLQSDGSSLEEVFRSLTASPVQTENRSK